MKLKQINIYIKLIIVFIMVMAVIFLGSIYYFFDCETDDQKLASFGTFISGIGGYIVVVLTGVGLLVTIYGATIAFHTYLASKEANEIAYIHAELGRIVDQIDKIQYREREDDFDKDGYLFQGLDALYSFSKKHWKNPNAVMNSVNSAIIGFNDLIEYVSHSIFIENNRKQFLNRIYITIYTKLLWPVRQRIWNEHRDELRYGSANRPQPHDDSKYILPSFGILFVETLQHLTNEKMIAGKESDIHSINDWISRANSA